MHMPHMCIMVIIMLLPQSCFVMACSLSRRTGGVSCRWVHVSTIRGICQPLFFIFFHHDAKFFSWRQESKHAKEECFSGFSTDDKEFSLSDVHTFFTDSFLLKMGSYGIIFVNGRVCVSARQAGQVRYRFDCRNFEGGIVCCHARNLIC